MSNIELEEMTEDQRTALEKKENRELKGYSRRLKKAMLAKIAEGKISEEFPELDGSNKQVYAIVAVVDQLDRDVQESEKIMANKETNNSNAALVNQVFEAILQKTDDPSNVMATGQRHVRDISEGKGRLLPDREASSQHMHKGNDVIEYNDVFVDNKAKKKD